ncbi:MAG: DUF1587 domain-containing protein, partial [Acidobacteriota bacterium]|nr:DUF1587 domain-containing protein [Acidobacteriota bacterium]
MNRLVLALLPFSLTLSAATFETAVRPLLSQTCTPCHNDKLTSGGLNAAVFLDPASLSSHREGWETILAKLRAGEMPPKGVPKPPAQEMDALVNYVEAEFDRADSLVKPDPGRVIAHRLNRNEYSNTIRDLLGVDFHAEEEFPIDDSSYGFDNIGAVLTVSPTLMQKYMQAAEQIASRAVGGDPLPKPGLFNKKNRIRRPETGTIEFKDRVDFDADYTVRVLMVGHRGDKDKPVTLVLSVDGKPIKTEEVSTQITAVNKQGGATNRVNSEQRVFLTQGDHVFRASFINDEAIKDIPVGARLNNNRNMYPETMEIAGPFPSTEPHPSQKKVLTCDPASGNACVNRILTALAHKAYRRPVRRDEVAELMKVYDQAKSGGYTAPQSLQFAIEAMLVSPQFLFRIEKDPKAGTSARVSDVELASRLSYFLWSSMPDD